MSRNYTKVQLLKISKQILITSFHYPDLGGLSWTGPFVSAAKFYDKFNWMFTSIMKLFKGKN